MTDKRSVCVFISCQLPSNANFCYLPTAHTYIHTCCANVYNPLALYLSKRLLLYATAKTYGQPLKFYGVLIWPSNLYLLAFCQPFLLPAPPVCSCLAIFGFGVWIWLSFRDWTYNCFNCKQIADQFIIHSIWRKKLIYCLFPQIW